MDRPASWIHRRMLPHLAVGTACLALTVVASADHTDDTVKASTLDDSAPAPEAPSPKRPAKSARSPIGYAEMVRRWHVPPTAPLAQSPAARPALVLEMLNTGERLELSPLRDDAGFQADGSRRGPHTLPH